MTRQDHNFADYCCELLAPTVGACRWRRMFGGYGISTGGLTFALVTDELLYLKTDAQSEAAWREAGCSPFTYASRGRQVKLNYHSAPPEAMESPAAMAAWARLALDCALRVQAARSRPRLPREDDMGGRKAREAGQGPGKRIRRAGPPGG